MKVKVKTIDFQKGINAVDGIISVREIKSILSNIKLEIKNNRMFLSATDLEISIKTSIDVENVIEGQTSLPAKQLNNLLKTINFENTLIEVKEDHQTIITDADGKYDFKLNINALEGEDFKTMPEIDYSKVVDFSCSTLKEMIRKTSFSIAQEDTRFVFNGLFLTADGANSILVGTDGRRLAKINRNFPIKLDIKKGIIIPHKAVREIMRMIDNNETGKIGIFENQIYVSSGNIELVCKLIDGNYPDYDGVIPKQTKYSIKISKENLNIALRQALIAAEEPIRQIRLKFSKQSLNINASTPGTTEVNINIPILYDGEELLLAFKGDYLSDILKVINDEEVIIQFSSTSTPVVFKDPSDEDFVSVIMPMKV